MRIFFLFSGAPAASKFQLTLLPRPQNLAVRAYFNVRVWILWKNEKRAWRFGRPCLVKFNLPHVKMLYIKHQISRRFSVELSTKSPTDVMYDVRDF